VGHRNRQIAERAGPEAGIGRRCQSSRFEEVLASVFEDESADASTGCACGPAEGAGAVTNTSPVRLRRLPSQVPTTIAGNDSPLAAAQLARAAEFAGSAAIVDSSSTMTATPDTPGRVDGVRNE